MQDSERVNYNLINRDLMSLNFQCSKNLRRNNSKIENHLKDLKLSPVDERTRAKLKVLKSQNINNLRQQITVNTKQAKAERPLVNTCIESLGWQRHNCTLTKGNIIWNGSSMSDCEHLQYVKNEQIVNRFPGLLQLTKKRMFATIMKLYNGLYPNIFDFIPQTWLLPDDRDSLNTLIGNNDKNVYIIKPDGGAMGHGLKLITRISDIEPSILSGNGKYIVQKYISNPLLIDGKKFDFRIYALIISVLGIPKCFISRLGMARFCTEEYHSPNRKNLSNHFMHLTNYSINKENNLKFIRSSNIHNRTNNKRLLEDIFLDLDLKGYNTTNIWKQIKELTAKSILCLYPWLNFKYKSVYQEHVTDISSCFQIIGLDILVDSHGKAWLLEINANPSLRIDYFDTRLCEVDIQLESSLDRYIKEPVLTEAFKIVESEILVPKISQYSLKPFIDNFKRKEIYNPNNEIRDLDQTKEEQICLNSAISKSNVLHLRNCFGELTENSTSGGENDLNNINLVDACNTKIIKDRKKKSKIALEGNKLRVSKCKQLTELDSVESIKREKGDSSYTEKGEDFSINADKREFIREDFNYHGILSFKKQDLIKQLFECMKLSAKTRSSMLGDNAVADGAIAIKQKKSLEVIDKCSNGNRRAISRESYIMNSIEDWDVMGLKFNLNGESQRNVATCERISLRSLRNTKNYTKLHKDVLSPLDSNEFEANCWLNLEPQIRSNLFCCEKMEKFKVLFERAVGYPKNSELKRMTWLSFCRSTKIVDIARHARVPIFHGSKKPVEWLHRSSSSYVNSIRNSKECVLQFPSNEQRSAINLKTVSRAKMKRIGILELEQLWSNQMLVLKRTKNDATGIGLLEFIRILENLAILCFPFLPSRYEIFSQWIAGKRSHEINHLNHANVCSPEIINLLNEANLNHENKMKQLSYDNSFDLNMLRKCKGGYNCFMENGKSYNKKIHPISSSLTPELTTETLLYPDNCFQNQNIINQVKRNGQVSSMEVGLAKNRSGELSKTNKLETFENCLMSGSELFCSSDEWTDNEFLIHDSPNEKCGYKIEHNDETKLRKIRLDIYGDIFTQNQVNSNKNCEYYAENLKKASPPPIPDLNIWCNKLREVLSSQIEECQESSLDMNVNPFDYFDNNKEGFTVRSCGMRKESDTLCSSKGSLSSHSYRKTSERHKKSDVNCEEANINQYLTSPFMKDKISSNLSKEVEELYIKNLSERRIEVPSWYYDVCCYWPNVFDASSEVISAKAKNEMIDHFIDFLQFRLGS